MYLTKEVNYLIKDKVEILVLKISITLFFIIFIANLLLINSKNSFMFGLMIGSIVSISRYALNSYGINFVLAKENKLNNLVLSIFNIFSIILVCGFLFITFYIMSNKTIDFINIYLLIGLLIGISIVSIVIIFITVLEILYKIRIKS